MCCNDYIINLVVAKEGSWLAQLCSDEQAESSSDYTSSSTKYYIKGADVFMVGGEESTCDCHR